MKWASFFQIHIWVTGTCCYSRSLVFNYINFCFHYHHHINALPYMKTWTRNGDHLFGNPYIKIIYKCSHKALVRECCLFPSTRQGCFLFKAIFQAYRKCPSSHISNSVLWMTLKFIFLFWTHCKKLKREY